MHRAEAECRNQNGSLTRVCLKMQLISIFTFAAQCLGCCPSQQPHVHTPANWELRQYGMLHFPAPPGGARASAQNSESKLLCETQLVDKGQLMLSMFQTCTGPAIIQISGMQPAPPPPQGRQARKQKVQPLTAELLNRLPSFFLASTSKARFSAGALLERHPLSLVCN